MADYVLGPGEPIPGVEEILESHPADDGTEVLVVRVENPDYDPNADPPLSRWMQTDLRIQRTG